MINEQSLQLVITDKSLGSLTTNALQIKAMVEAALPDYNIANYADNLDLAKSDKAMLNKSKKALNDERIKIEREFMKPFEEFKGIVSGTCKLIDSCTAKIDSVVKEADEIEREKKRDMIAKLWEEHGTKIVPLAKAFNEKWLLKSAKEKDIIFSIQEKALSIESDMRTLEAIGEDVETLKAMYLESLNLNETIQYSMRLKENRARLAAAEPSKPEPTPVVYEDVSAPTPTNSFCETEIIKITGALGEIARVKEWMDGECIEYEVMK